MNRHEEQFAQASNATRTVTICKTARQAPRALHFANSPPTGCRRAAEYELRRIQRHLERLEAQRESPFFVKDTERAIAALEARLRTLLEDGNLAFGDRRK